MGTSGGGCLACYRDMQVLIVWVCKQPGCNRSAPAPLVAIYWERRPVDQKSSSPLLMDYGPSKGVTQTNLRASQLRRRRSEDGFWIDLEWKPVSRS